MIYRIAPLFCRPWTLNGIPPSLIESHYEHNYGSAVTRLNEVAALLAGLDRRATSPALLARLKQEEAALASSALLHEIYFASLGGDGRAPTPAAAAALARDFGAVDAWRAEFMALAEGLGGDPGWVLLAWLPRQGRLANVVARGHGEGVAGGVPILALDMHEHAYAAEWGANAAAYVAAFMRNIDWKAATDRLEDAGKVPPPRPLIQPEFDGVAAVSPEAVRAMLAEGRAVQIVDARPRHYAARATDIVAGAVWRDPEKIDAWIGTLDKSLPVVAFCVYGFHIGCTTAAALKAAGYDAAYMAGGHYAWKALKGPTRLLSPEETR